MIDAKTLFYVNEHSIFYTMQCLNKPRQEKENFIIYDQLAYLMDFFSLKADAMGKKLKLKKEACLPTEVNGDRDKLELILATIFDYMMQNSESEEITLSADLKNSIPGGYMVSFDFIFQPASSSTYESLQAFFKNDVNGSYEDINSRHGFPMRFCLCKSIVKFLEGNMDIAEGDSHNLKLHIELPFESRDTKPLVDAPQLNIFAAQKQGELITTWEKRKEIEKAPLEKSQTEPQPPASQTNLSKTEEDTLKSLIRSKQNQRKGNNNNDVCVPGEELKENNNGKAPLAQEENKCPPGLYAVEEVPSSDQISVSGLTPDHGTGPQSGEKVEQKRTFSFVDDLAANASRGNNDDCPELIEEEEY